MAEQFKELSDRDWLLIRGHNIIGSLQPVEQESFLFNLKEKKFIWSKYQAVPALLKIINEIIDNSLDVAIKSNFRYANKISIDIDTRKVHIQDNGYGIPVKETEDGNWLPVVAWGKARAGTNFDDDENRVSAGMNGIGSFASAVFSKKFVGITDDGHKKLKVTFKNNCETAHVELLQSKEQGTSVTFWPDLERFGMDEIDELHQSLILQRILNLSMLYPQIRFRFNKKLIKLDAKKFLGLFSEEYEFVEEDNYMIAVFPNASFDFNFHTYINGLWLEKGGNHVNFISGKIVEALRDKLIRRYKSIKPGDIKNKLSLLVFFRNFKNAKFDGQTKEFLTNTQKDITAHLNWSDPGIKKDWERFTLKVYKNKAIIEPITDLYNAKMLIEEKKKIKAASKKQDAPEKYWPATDENKYLFLAEGDSAINAIIAELGREKNGFFPLKGVPLNVVKDRSKLSKNTEINQIANILGIDLTSDSDQLNYSNIIIASDRDVDGFHIAGILIGLFATFTRKYLDEGKLFLFVTPLLSALDKKGNVTFLFSMDEYNEFRKTKDPSGSKYIYDYKKGLGTMEEFEWEALFKQFALEELLQPLHLKDSDNPEEELQELYNWLADDTEFRKARINGKIASFDINKV